MSGKYAELMQSCLSNEYSTMALFNLELKKVGFGACEGLLDGESGDGDKVIGDVDDNVVGTPVEVDFIVGVAVGLLEDAGCKVVEG